MEENEQSGEVAAEAPILVASGAGLDAEPDVALVIPPPAYEAIATTDEEAAPTRDGPGPDVAAPVLEAIGVLGNEVLARLDGLQARFDREVRAEAAREKVVDRL